jgi:CheY-like chemotaxis protein
VTAAAGPPRGSVLVVDDDMVSRLVLAQMLRRMGFDVLEADDVGPAIDMMAGSELSAVFCDFSMPGGTGLDVLARLGRGPGHPAFVLVTGIVDAARVDGTHFDAHFNSVDSYLTKPVSTRALRACVDEVLSNRSSSP